MTESPRRLRRIFATFVTNVRGFSIFLSPVLLGAALVAQARPCVAYRSNGELRANCGGKDVLLLKKRGLASFAIGVDGGTVLGGADWAYMVRDGTWIKLHVPPGTRTLEIKGTCGTALAPQGLFGNVTIDLLAGAPKTFTGLKRPQCSANRSLIVGVNSKGELVTNRGKILEARSDLGYSFAVSPSGRWIAYYRSPLGHSDELCIFDASRKTTRRYSGTVAGSGGFDDGTNGGLSVNDAGTVLLVAPYKGSCWYASAGTLASRSKFPGAGADTCFGVAIASQASAPRVIIPLGFRPAWVDERLLRAQFGVFK
jgi:hypothetical protein